MARNPIRDVSEFPASGMSLSVFLSLSLSFSGILTFFVLSQLLSVFNFFRLFYTLCLWHHNYLNACSNFK